MTVFILNYRFDTIIHCLACSLQGLIFTITLRLISLIESHDECKPTLRNDDSSLAIGTFEQSCVLIGLSFYKFICPLFKVDRVSFMKIRTFSYLESFHHCFFRYSRESNVSIMFFLRKLFSLHKCLLFPLPYCC